jgi:Arc/MetJ family transcription regulator
MRTNIVLEDNLITQAMRLTGLRTRRATVEAGLQLLIHTYSQAGVRPLRGKVTWEGNLEESRADRVQEEQAAYKP